MTRYTLPTLEDLLALGARQDSALTVYLPTTPTPAGRETARTAVKSAMDEGARALRSAGASFAEEGAWRRRSAAIAADPLWEELAASVALFVWPHGYDAYVLPNALEAQTQFGHWFDIGQLVRAVTTPQRAYALTISSNAWNLWEATATTRARLLDLEGDLPEDAADATNRASIRGRSHYRRLAGDEGKKVLLDTYALRVGDAVRAELARLDPNAAHPLYLFATDPLLGMLRARDTARRIEVVQGNPDELKDYEIDAAIRASLPAINAEANSRLVDGLGAKLRSGRAVTDLAAVARAAFQGAIDTIVYDFTVDVLGRIDPVTGAVEFDDDGYDLLSRIVIEVLRTGGEAIAVRPGEITAEAWNGQVIAALRHPLA